MNPQISQISTDSKGEKDPESHAVIGAAMEVHRILGRGFLENVYHDALAEEFTVRSVPFRNEVDFPVHYKGVILGSSYRADFVCYTDLIVELKALDAITPRERSQVINYLKASGCRRGLLLNFGSSSLQYERLVFG